MTVLGPGGVWAVRQGVYEEVGVRLEMLLASFSSRNATTSYQGKMQLQCLFYPNISNIAHPLLGIIIPCGASN